MSEGITSKPDLVSLPLGQPTWVRWRIVALLMALSFVSWFNRVSLPVAYDDRIRDQYAISETAIGWVYSTLLFVYMLCMTPGGWFTDRFGARWSLGLMGLGLGLFVALTGATGVLASGTMLRIALFAIRGTMGLFAAPMYPAASHAVAQWMPFPGRASANGLVQGAAPLGIATTYILFGLLIDRFDWPRAFALTGAATALLGLVWLLYARNQPNQHSGVNAAELSLIRTGDPHGLPGTDAERAAWSRDEPGSPPSTALQADSSEKTAAVTTAAGLDSPDVLTAGTEGVAASFVFPEGGWLGLLRNRSLVLLTLAYGAVGYFEYLFFFWMHYYFDDVLQLGKEQSRLFSAIPVLAMAAGMPLGGLLSDLLLRAFGLRWGRALVPAGGMLIAAAMLGLGVLASNPLWIVTLFALALGAMGATEGPQWTVAIELGGRRGATAAGIFNTGGNLGGLIAPVLTPWISTHFGWQWGISAGGFVCLAGVLLWIWIDPRERVGGA